MKRSAISAIAVAAVLGAMPVAHAKELKAEVMHWFTSPGEVKAIQVYVKEFESRGGKWIDNAIAGGANARAAIVNRIAGGDPPTAAQFNTKLQFKDLLDAGLMGDVQSVATADNWDSVLPPLFAQTLKYDDKYIAAPMNIQGQNWLWWNVHVLDAAGAKAPSNYKELFEALDKVKKAGNAVPLAFQGEPVWTRYIFNNTLLNYGGKKLYESIYVDRDPKAVHSPEFRDVIETTLRLKQYTDEGAPARKWVDAAQMVASGKAAFHIMGDWAKGELTNAGLKYGTDYGCTQLGGIYMLNSNIMTFPKQSDPDQIAAQELLARSLMDPEAEVEMANFKGSAPARLDVDKSKLDECTQQGLERVAHPEQLALATEMLISPQRQGALEDLFVSLWSHPDSSIDDFINKFADALTAPE